jgi:hypothetical protein
LIAAGTRKNEKINALVVHEREITTFENSLEGIVSEAQGLPLPFGPLAPMGKVQESGSAGSQA